MELIEVVLTFVKFNLLSDDIVVVNSHPHDMSLLWISNLYKPWVCQMFLNLNVVSKDLDRFLSNDLVDGKNWIE